MPPALKRELRNYPWYFLLWTGIALFFCSQALMQKLVTREPTPWWHYLISWLVGMYLWALMTPLILWLGRRLPIERRNWLRRIALHLVLSIGLVIMQLASENAILSRLRVFPSIMNGFVPTLIFLFLIGFHTGIVTYFTVVGIQYGIRYYLQYQEREQQALRLELHTSQLKTQLVDAQLSALKMQLQPHFLFNTLNAIMVLVRQHKGRQAQEMLARLSDLLRCVLEDVASQEVPLRRELEYLELYLAIEQVRFPDRLHSEIAADPAVLDSAIPQMSLQPIVENAIRHGIGRSSAAGRIEVRAARLDDMLKITIKDDGPGLSLENLSGSTGIGLPNTRARLRQLYDDEGKLTVENSAQGGVLVTMTLPYHLAAGAMEREVMEVHALDDTDRR